MSPSLHRFPSSLGRGLDVRLPANRWIVILMTAAALVSGWMAWAREAGSVPETLLGAGVGGASVLGSWALGRELAPDDQRAAFVAAALAYGTLLWEPSQSLWLLFTALLLARIVNRTVGGEPRSTDSLIVTALVGVTIASTGRPSVGLVAAGAFALDAILPGGRRTQWGFSTLCLILSTVAALTPIPARTGAGPRIMLASPSWLMFATPVTVLFLLAIVRTHALASRGDLSGELLSEDRVRAGMVSVLALALLSLTGGDHGARQAGQLWAALTAVGVSSLFPRGTGPT